MKNQSFDPSVSLNRKQASEGEKPAEDEVVDAMLPCACADKSGTPLLPWKLHIVLEEAERLGREDIVSWLPCGTSFKVHNKKEFAKIILPKYFSTTKYKSFQRSLNLWGFQAYPKGPKVGASHHPLFLKGRPGLCSGMKRVRVKKNQTPEPITAMHDQDEERLASLAKQVSPVSSAPSFLDHHSFRQSPYHLLPFPPQYANLVRSTPNPSSHQGGVPSNDGSNFTVVAHPHLHATAHRSNSIESVGAPPAPARNLQVQSLQLREAAKGLFKIGMACQALEQEATSRRHEAAIMTTASLAIAARVLAATPAPALSPSTSGGSIRGNRFVDDLFALQQRLRQSSASSIATPTK